MKENNHIWRKARKKPIVVEFREVDGKEQIETQEGVLIAKQNEDYIIRGVDGEIYPIKKSIFYHTYEVIEEKDMNELKSLDFGEILKIIEADFGDFRKAYEIEKYIKQCIRVACEFYLKYKDDPELLIKEYPEYKKEIEERNKEFLSIAENLKQSLIPDVVKGVVLSFKHKEYNNWLFKLAFKSILDEELKLYNE